MYPEVMEINGKEYKINTDYRIALACFKAINDTDINDMERLIAVVTLLLGKDFPLELMGEAIDKCAIYLRCGKKENQEEEEIDMDYEQDRGRIMASFMSCYHLDITKEKLHWWAYNDLIEGFGEDEILTRVRNIRNYDLNDVKDKKEREKIRKAQEELRLKPVKTKEQKELDKFWDNILGGGENGDNR